MGISLVSKTNEDNAWVMCQEGPRVFWKAELAFMLLSGHGGRVGPKA